MAVFSHLLQLFFPRTCLSCKEILSEGEKYICHRCLAKLPYTGYRLDDKNDIYKQIIPFVEIEAATSLLFFSKQGMVQELMHQLKYKGHQEIGTLFGEILGNRILKENPLLNIDLVVPVPLHPKKLKQRGYNQLTEFGKKLSEKLQAGFEENLLLKIKQNETQTKKNALERKQNVKGMFGLNNPGRFKNKHILLIDDVITTGATLVEAAGELKKTEAIKISVATIATADQL